MKCDSNVKKYLKKKTEEGYNLMHKSEFYSDQHADGQLILFELRLEHGLEILPEEVK